MTETVDIKARTDIAVTAAKLDQHIQECGLRYAENSKQLRDLKVTITDGFETLHSRVSRAIKATDNWKLHLAYGVIMILLTGFGAVLMTVIPWNG